MDAYNKLMGIIPKNNTMTNEKDIFIPSDERKDYHHDHNESNVSQLLEMTRRCEFLWQTVAGLKMMMDNHLDQQTKNELTTILDEYKPY